VAREVITRLVDDRDRRTAADETIRFSVDGIHYITDLARANAKRFRDTMQPWIDAARKADDEPTEAIPPEVEAAYHQHKGQIPQSAPASASPPKKAPARKVAAKTRRKATAAGARPYRRRPPVPELLEVFAQEGGSATAVARRLKVPLHTVTGWQRTLRKDGTAV
jgi:Lsr2